MLGTGSGHIGIFWQLAITPVSFGQDFGDDAGRGAECPAFDDEGGQWRQNHIHQIQCARPPGTQAQETPIKLTKTINRAIIGILK